MLISYKNYQWINPETGKKPVTGDEFLYVFFSSKEEPDKKYLCMNPPVHPIKKHPLGFLGWFLCVVNYFIGDKNDLFFVFILIIGGLFISGTMFSFLTYIPYFFQEKKWKKQVLNDWKSGVLRYKYSESKLSKFGDWGSPQDESLFY